MTVSANGTAQPRTIGVRSPWRLPAVSCPSKTHTLGLDRDQETKVTVARPQCGTAKLWALNTNM